METIMLSSEITFWDVMWLLQSVFMVVAVFLAYREGQKNPIDSKYHKHKVTYVTLPESEPSDQMETFYDRYQRPRKQPSPLRGQRYRTY